MSTITADARTRLDGPHAVMLDTDRRKVGRVHGFARREFQLMLLRRMADFRPDLVAAACEEMDAPHSEYMKAHNRWQSMLRSRRAPAGLALYRAVLGPPDDERPLRIGDAALTSCTWRLPGLWPHLRWEAVIGEAGVALHGWLVRDGESPVPDLPLPERLAPWSCVVGDVEARMAGARAADPQINSRWLVFADDDQGRQWRLVFVHGLFQTAELASPSEPVGIWSSHVPFGDGPP